MKQFLHIHPAKVVRWVDADTVILTVHLDYNMQTVPIRHRMLWIDAYEKRTALGKRAILRVNELAPVGSEVIVRSYEIDGEEDNFGRWLCEVFVGDISINQLLLQEGLATVYEED